MSDNPVRVLVVDDTVVYRKIISDLLAEIPEVEVVGTAPNGKIAIQKCAQLQPDLLTLDLEMPELDGLGVLRHLREHATGTGAIMLSAFTTQGADATVMALELGAFDFVVKPTGGASDESLATLRRELVPKLLAFVRKHRVRTALRGATSPKPAAQSTHPETPAQAPVPPAAVARPVPRGKPRVIGIGISTGGPQALNILLPQLPADLAVPVLIVQHMPPMFTKSLADGLDERCALSVREAVDDEAVMPGSVLIAPGGRQMKVEAAGAQAVIRLTDDPPEQSCRPAVDYLFRSIANVYGGNAAGVIMTGMGSDGTLGCRLMKRRGATILTQDEASCVVYGMPKAPAEEGLSDMVLPLNELAAEITRLVGRGTPVCR